jgi:hypothetical protein
MHAGIEYSYIFEHIFDNIKAQFTGPSIPKSVHPFCFVFLRQRFFSNVHTTSSKHDIVYFSFGMTWPDTIS